LRDFIERCATESRSVSVLCPHLAAMVAGKPSLADEVVRPIFLEHLGGSEDDFSFLVPWLARFRALREKPLTAQFIGLPGETWKQGEGGPWGTEKPGYPWCTAVERHGQRGSIIHAFLHLVGVDEGYDEDTHGPAEPCIANCWMQWAPNDECVLCASHADEIRTFLSDTSPSAIIVADSNGDSNQSG
jgi:hypothetical protein